MACRVLTGDGWANGWLKGWACAGCLLVMVAGVDRVVCAESVQICDGGEFRPVRTEEVPEHDHTETVPATSFDNANGVSISGGGTTTTAAPDDQPFFDTSIVPSKPQGTPEWLLPTVFDCPEPWNV